MSAKIPSTVEDAVDCLMAIMPDAEQRTFAGMPDHLLIENHLGLGLWIRNNFGLWSGNESLLVDTGALDVDGASAVIVRAFWLKLRSRLGVPPNRS